MVIIDQIPMPIFMIDQLSKFKVSVHFSMESMPNYSRPITYK